MVNNTQVRYVNANGGNDLPNNSWWTWAVGIWNWAVGSGFFEQGVYAEQLIGPLTNDSATGGPLDLLEQQAGVSFPDLQAMRQGVVDSWRAWQNSFWNRRAMLDAYKLKCKEFAEALDARKIEYFGGEGPVPIAGFWPWLEKNWKIVTLVGFMSIGLSVGVYLTTRGLSRQK